MSFNLGIAAALAGTASYTVEDTASKFVSELFGNRTTSIAVMGIGILPAFVAFLVFGAGGYLNVYQIGLVALSAVFLAAGYLLVYKSLETEQVSNTFVLFEITPVVMVLFGTFALSEKLTLMQSVSVLAIFAGVLCVTTNVKQRLNKMLLPAIIGMVLWGAYTIPITYAIRGSGGFVLPILIVQALSFAMIATYLVLARLHKSTGVKRHIKLNNKIVLTALACGISAGIGMLLFGYVFLSNVVALGGAINSLGQAFMMLLGRIFYKDRWTRLQFAGLVVMVIGAIALSL